MSDVTGQTRTAPSRGAVSPGRIAVAVFAPGRLAILIVNWNARDLLLRCLGVPRPPSPPGHRRRQRLGGWERRRGRAALSRGDAGAIADESRLRGRRQSRAARGAVGRGPKADCLLLLNPDTVATAGAIDALAAALADRRAIGAVGGRLVHPDGSPQTGFNVRRFPTLGSFAMDLLLIDQVWPDNPWTRRYLARDLDRRPATPRPMDVDQPAAACLMVRAAAFDAIGGMDERFHPAWFEDVDFCRRLRAAGYRIRFEPRATFVHQGGVAMRTLGLGRFSSIWYANMERYVRRHHGTAGWLLLKGLIGAGHERADCNFVAAG